MGCTSTRTREGGEDAAARPALDAESDADAEALGVALCSAAGGLCATHSRAGGTFPACALVGPPQACDPGTIGGGGTLCCAVPEAGTCTEISASNYDQSCTRDSDCILIGEGDSCGICVLNCPRAAINIRARGQYMSDIANTTAAISSNLPACEESCGLMYRPPCCWRGKCQVDYGECGLPGVPRDAASEDVDAFGADTGGDAASE
jgi:hypothetical protein